MRNFADLRSQCRDPVAGAPSLPCPANPPRPSLSSEFRQIRTLPGRCGPSGNRRVHRSRTQRQPTGRQTKGSRPPIRRLLDWKSRSRPGERFARALLLASRLITSITNFILIASFDTCRRRQLLRGKRAICRVYGLQRAVCVIEEHAFEICFF
jgi:hypothetical protein